MVKTFEIKTRIMSQPNGSSKLKLIVKNGWSFWSIFTVKDSKELRTYLKSDEFKEFAYSVFSKYEGMNYTEMHNTDRNADFNKIWEKLDGFAWRADEKPFRITVDVKLTKTYRNGFTYRVAYSNNKDGRRCWTRKFAEGNYIDKVCANEMLDDFWRCLNEDKAFNDKLSSYKTWDEFWDDLSHTRDIHNLVDNCMQVNKCMAA